MFDAQKTLLDKFWDQWGCHTVNHGALLRLRECGQLQLTLSWGKKKVFPLHGSLLPKRVFLLDYFRRLTKLFRVNILLLYSIGLECSSVHS